MEEEKREAEQAAKYQSQAKTGFGSQIRNYFLHPDQRVKDARTGHLVGNFQSVLDGNALQGFLDTFLRWRVGKEEHRVVSPLAVLSGAGWQLVFEQHADRIRHRIEVESDGHWRTLVESVEGAGQPWWPPSPPLQSLHVESRLERQRGPAGWHVGPKPLVGQHRNCRPTGQRLCSTWPAAHRNARLARLSLPCRNCSRRSKRAAGCHVRAA